MIIFPAIDLKDGAVRAAEARRDGQKPPSSMPIPPPRPETFAVQGFQWLHCVDLNGAFAGKSVNGEAIKSIRAAIELPIQLGGGIRDLGRGRGVAGGRHHPRDPGYRGADQSAFVKEARAPFPGRIVVGADAKGGRIATKGWAEVSELTPVELGRRFEDAGVAAILFTDIDGDGLLKGLNVTATAALARGLSIPVIASGGVGSIADIDALIAAHEPISKGLWWGGPFMTAG